MKTSLALLLALLLMAILFTGCGEEDATDVTTTADNTTTTVAEEVGTTVSDSTTTTTMAAATTTKRPTTDHANGTGGTTAAPTTTTTAAKPTTATIDPKNYKDNYYYVGTLQPDGDGLVRPRLLFEGEYCVIMHYTYSATKTDDDQQPFEYQGKTYYGEGEGMSPYQFELTATEIVVKDQNNNNTAVMKLALQSDGNMRVTATTDPFFPVGLILTPTAQ